MDPVTRREVIKVLDLVKKQLDDSCSEYATSIGYLTSMYSQAVAIEDVHRIVRGIKEKYVQSKRKP